MTGVTALWEEFIPDEDEEEEQLKHLEGDLGSKMSDVSTSCTLQSTALSYLITIRIPS